MVKYFDTSIKTTFKRSSSRPIRIDHHLHNRDDAKLCLKRGYPMLSMCVHLNVTSVPGRFTFRFHM